MLYTRGVNHSRRSALCAGATLLGACLASSPSILAASSGVPPRPARQPSLDGFINLSDFETLAERRLSARANAMVQGGAADENTLRWNREAFNQVRLRPHILTDVSHIDTRVSLFGCDLPHPILLAPTAFHGMIHPRGELETVEGASAAKALLVVSSASNTRIQPIADRASGPLWFQMYVQSDRGFVTDVVREVEAAGSKALVVTVDAPVVGVRYRQMRVRFRLDKGLKLPYMYDVNRGRDSLLRGGNSRMTWDDLEWLRSITQLPILLKGVMHPDDAEKAVAAGVSGLVVSNHGGRSLDTAPSTLSALPGVVDRVQGRIPILMDGGIRRGTDILKALAFGARAVLIGRPYLHGLAVGGASGIARVTAILRDELEQAMALTGCTRLDTLDRGVLWEETAVRP